MVCIMILYKSRKSRVPRRDVKKLEKKKLVSFKTDITGSTLFSPCSFFAIIFYFFALRSDTADVCGLQW